MSKYDLKTCDFEIIKDTWEPDGLDCEHPLCERFHAKGCPPPAKRTEWYIIRKSTDSGRANTWDQCQPFDLKRDAVKSLKYWLTHCEKLGIDP